MSVGKTTRFEVFARDGFTCQYCGRRPPDVVLELDHVHPKSKDGQDDPINLVTACFDCNRGKRDKVITEIAPRPDADVMFLRTQQEIAEVNRFIEAKKELDAANAKLCEVLQGSWAEKLTKKIVPSEKTLLPWIKKYGPEEIEAAMVCAIPAFLDGRFGYGEEREFYKLLPYVGAILRNRQNRSAGLPDKGEN